MGEPQPTDKRTTNPLGIIVALGALGLLLVLLFFNSSPSTDLPPDQGPMAMAVVDNMMTNGVLVDYDCTKNTGGCDPVNDINCLCLAQCLQDPPCQDLVFTCTGNIADQLCDGPCH